MPEYKYANKDRHNYYLNIAEAVLEKATCYRKHYGAVIVKNNEIIATGYNGAPRGRSDCYQYGKCIRLENKIPRGTRYELCKSVHAEQNAIISASRKDMIGSTLYLVGIDMDDFNMPYIVNAQPCMMCKKMIINAGISQVIARNTKDDYTIYNVDDWLVNMDEMTPDDFGY